MKEIDLIAGRKGCNLDYNFPAIVDDFIKRTEFRNYNLTEFFKVGIGCAMCNIFHSFRNTYIIDEVISLFIPKELEYSVFSTFWFKVFEDYRMGFDILSTFVLELKNERLSEIYSSGIEFRKELIKYMIIPLWDEIGIDLANELFGNRFNKDNITKEQMNFFLCYLEQLPVIICNDGNKGKRHFISEIEELYINKRLTESAKEIILDYLYVYFTTFNIH